MNTYIINGQRVNNLDIKDLKKRNKPENLGLNFSIPENFKFEKEYYVRFITRTENEMLSVSHDGKHKVMKLYTERETVSIGAYKYFNSWYCKDPDWEVCRKESTFGENGIYILERFRKIITEPKEIINWLNNNY